MTPSYIIVKTEWISTVSPNKNEMSTWQTGGHAQAATGKRRNLVRHAQHDKCQG